MSQARFLVGDVFEKLKTLPDDSVDLVLTSPPFLALRSYLPDDHPQKALEIGAEPTPAAFLDTLLDVVEECDRVLAPHGSLVFELGDTYSGSGGGGGDYLEGGLREGQPGFGGSKERQKEGNAAHWRKKNEWKKDDEAIGWPLDKSLTGIPTLFTWSLAYGRNLLRPEHTLDQWRIRNLIVWCRPNPPVGALADKFRPASSYMTVACKSKQRFFDLDAVRHPADPANKRTSELKRNDIPGRTDQVMNPLGEDGQRIISNPGGAPPLDWWEVTTQPYKGSHYATWPEKLLIKPILAMCPEKVCTICGEPSRRIVERDADAIAKNLEVRDGRSKDGRGDEHGYDSYGGFETASTKTIGWSDCGHDSWRRGVVLDPFGGSGTTGVVATGHGRDAILIDIDERNAELARERIGMFLTVEQ